MKPKDKGRFLGECRLSHNILEQWDGKKWRRVPDVEYPTLSFSGRLHFDVEDALHD